MNQRNSPAAPGQAARDAGFDARYEAILAACPEATFFHTRLWAAIVREGFPGCEDRSEILAAGGREHALPLFRLRRLGGLLTGWHSGFPFLYGGPVPCGEAALAAVRSSLAARKGSVVLIGNPFAGGLDAGTAGPGGAACEGLALVPETTHLLALPADAETYWSEVLDTRKRNDIRRLARKGVRVETTREPADIAAVHALYRARMASWRRKPGLVYPESFHRAMVSLGGQAVRCYVARYEGRVIGGAFVARWNGIAHYNAGYFAEEARALRPNVLIQERIIRDAIEDGFHLYDMLPSAGLPNVEAFKESFGGVRTRFPRWERIAGLHRLARELRRLRGRLRERPADEP